MKTYMIVAVFPLVAALTGCTSMQPMDGNTRAFIDGAPGATSEYRTLVVTKSGDPFFFNAHDVRFDTAGGQPVLVGMKLWKDLDTAVGKKFYASDISSISFDEDITIVTNDDPNGTIEAGGGRWKFVFDSSRHWAWKASPAYCHLEDEYEYKDTTLQSKDIKSILIKRFDQEKMMLGSFVMGAGLLLEAYKLEKDGTLR